jgi:hypothetical protein
MSDEQTAPALDEPKTLFPVAIAHERWADGEIRQRPVYTAWLAGEMEREPDRFEVRYLLVDQAASMGAVA